MSNIIDKNRGGIIANDPQNVPQVSRKKDPGHKPMFFPYVHSSIKSKALKSGILYINFEAFAGLPQLARSTTCPIVNIDVIDTKGNRTGEISVDLSRRGFVQLFVPTKSATIRMKFDCCGQLVGSLDLNTRDFIERPLLKDWFAIGSQLNASVLLQLFWSCVSPRDMFDNRVESSLFRPMLLMLKKKAVIPGEVIRGIAVCRDVDLRGLKHYNLVFKGRIVSTQSEISDTKNLPDAKINLFRCGTILSPHHKDVQAASMKSRMNELGTVYTFEFEFTVPFNLPPSDRTGGIQYFVTLEEILTDGQPGRKEKLFFNVDKVDFPMKMLVPLGTREHPYISLMDEDLWACPLDEPATLTRGAPVGGDIKSRLVVDDDISSSSESGSESIEGGSDSEDLTGRNITKRLHGTHTDIGGGNLASKREMEGRAHVDHPGKSSKKHKRGDRQTRRVKQRDPTFDISEFDLEEARVLEREKELASRPVVTSRTRHDARHARATTELPAISGTIWTLNKNAVIPIRHANGEKIIRVPIAISNTTSKPLHIMRLSLKMEVTKYLLVNPTAPVLADRFKKLTPVRYNIREWEFKDDFGGDALAPGGVWNEERLLSIDERLPPTISSNLSPMFTRTYYIKIKVMNNRNPFSSSRLKMTSIVDVPNYDFDTRPLPAMALSTVPNAPLVLACFENDSSIPKILAHEDWSETSGAFGLTGMSAKLGLSKGKHYRSRDVGRDIPVTSQDRYRGEYDRFRRDYDEPAYESFYDKDRDLDTRYGRDVDIGRYPVRSGGDFGFDREMLHRQYDDPYVTQSRFGMDDYHGSHMRTKGERSMKYPHSRLHPRSYYEDEEEDWYDYPVRGGRRYDRDMPLHREYVGRNIR